MKSKRKKIKRIRVESVPTDFLYLLFSFDSDSEKNKDVIKKLSKRYAIKSENIVVELYGSMKDGLDQLPKLHKLLKRVLKIDTLYIFDEDLVLTGNFTRVWLHKESEVKGFKLGFINLEGVTELSLTRQVSLKKVLDYFTKYDKAYKQNSIRITLNEKNDKGERIGKIPFGYKFSKVKKKLVPLKGEQKVIETILNKRNEKLSFGKIQAYLEEHRIKGPSGYRWNRTTIQNIVKRENKIRKQINKE